MSFEAERAERREQEEEMREAGQSEEERRDDACESKWEAAKAHQNISSLNDFENQG